MKKLVTLLIAMLSMAVAINAQSLKFEIDGVEYESGSTYIKEVRFTDSDMPYKIHDTEKHIRCNMHIQIQKRRRHDKRTGRI